MQIVTPRSINHPCASAWSPCPVISRFSRRHTCCHLCSGVICYRCRLALGFCRFLWLRNSGWPRQAFSPFFTAFAASRHDGACGGSDAPSTDGGPPVVL